MWKYLISIVLLSLSFTSFSQTDGAKKEGSLQVPQTKEWYQKFAIRGYAQVRYNRLLETNDKLGCEQCDKSWGEGGGFFIRRMRIIFFGQISDQVYFYVQPDFASSISSTGLHFTQLRDAYFDVGLDKKTNSESE